MKKQLLILCFAINICGANAQNFKFAKQLGSTGSDWGVCTKTDDSGFIYTTGYFSGTVDFDPSPGIFNLVSAGSSDIFILKLDANGKFIWAKSMGGASVETGFSLDIDVFGNIFLTGGFSDSCDFDPSSKVFYLTSSGYLDIFILKIDRFGNFLWAKSLGGTATDWGFSIAVDEIGNVYTTGMFQNTIDFDPSISLDTTTSFGSADVFVLKLDSSGSYIWGRKIGGQNYEDAISLSLDNNNNLFITGTYSGTTDFNPGAAIDTLTSFGGNDVFICKLDSAGEHLWSKGIGGHGTDQAGSLFVDQLSNIYITGIFNETADFDPSNGTNSITAIGVSDVFISKLDSTGKLIWAKHFGGDSSYCSSRSISVDPMGNIYTTGFFTRTVDFNPNNNVDTLSSLGNFDIFISKLDSTGNFDWAKRIGGTGDDLGMGITLDASNSIISTGYFNGKVDFDPWLGTFNLTSAGDNDIFISKFEQCQLAILNQPANTNINVGSNAQFAIKTSSATSSYQWQVNAGSSFTNLSNNSQYLGATKDTLFINNVTFSQNYYRYRCIITDGTCIDTSNDAMLSVNCILTFTNQPANQITFVDSTAQFMALSSSSTATFQWQENTGSGFVNLFSNSGQYSGVKNDSLYISNVTLSQNNNKYRCIIKESGCVDTSKEVVLNVNCALTIISQPTDEIAIAGDTVQYVVNSSSNKSTFQWQQNSGTGFINLSNFGQYIGVNTNTLTIKSVKKSQDNYGFRCLVKDGACIDSSKAALLSVGYGVGLNQSNKSNFSIYPNPSTDFVTITYNKSHKTLLNIYNIWGELVYNTIWNNEHQKAINLSNLPKGLYFIRLDEEVQKVIIE